MRFILGPYGARVLREKTMAKKAAAKFDRAGLASLGAEKLAEILLDEASANKALKLRLQAALAGTAGSTKVLARIDKRLDQIERSASGITANRARELSTELGGMMRTIGGELGDDPVAAAERMVRMMSVMSGMTHRLYDRSAKLEKLSEDIIAAAVSMIAALPDAGQVMLVPALEKVRAADKHRELGDVFSQMMAVLGTAAADTWKKLLEGALKNSRSPQHILQLLQDLAVKRQDFDEVIRLEEAKPELYQDSLVLAHLLFDAQRFEQALDWVRRKPKGMRVIRIGGMTAAAGPDYGVQERKLLEADILERLKRRGDAQALRWQEFCETFEPDVLRTYIAKLDDFAEFEEMDKALHLVMTSKDAYKSLWFLIGWPKLDLAARLVIDHAQDWDGRQYELLSTAAEKLSEEQPEAATVLYRVLVSDILKRSLSQAYHHAASYLVALADLVPRVSAINGQYDHVRFMQSLRLKHAKKYSFWMLLPEDLR